MLLNWPGDVFQKFRKTVDFCLPASLSTENDLEPKPMGVHAQIKHIL